MRKVNTYSQVADKAGLLSIKRIRYLKYMRKRWPSREKNYCSYGYAEEWALRFRSHMEWLMSDRKGQVILSQIDKELEI